MKARDARDLMAGQKQSAFSRLLEEAYDSITYNAKSGQAWAILHTKLEDDDATIDTLVGRLEIDGFIVEHSPEAGTIEIGW